MPTIAPPDQETALRLQRAAGTLAPGDDASILLRTLPQRFEVSAELQAAYTADLLNPAPALPNCRANAPCYRSMCADYATGAAAGSPGTWSPSGNPAPTNAAQANTMGIVASPATLWTPGQYVQGSTAGAAGEMYWDGTKWVAGRSPSLTPTLIATNPNSFPVGATNNAVLINGTNFVNPTTVSITPPGGGAAVPPTTVTFTDANWLDSLWPDSVFATAGTGSVTVTNANGTSNSVNFTVA